MDATELERWMLFMKSDEKTKEALAMESPTMREAFEEIERLSQNPETRRLADFREQELMDILQREEDAREKEIEQGKRDIVFRMHTKGVAQVDIALFTGLAMEKTEEIITAYKQ